jgi:diguanylate cyclase (GGDEF)-like protein
MAKSPPGAWLVKTGSARALLSFFAPGGLLLLATALLLRQIHLPAASYNALRFGFFVLTISGILLSWRFHSSRVSSVLVALVLVEEALTAQRAPGASTEVTFGVIAFLVPLNFVLMDALRETGLDLASLVPRLGVLLADFVAFGITGQKHTAARNLFLPRVAELAFAVALTVFVVRFIKNRKPVEAGFFWGLLACVLGLMAINAGIAPIGYLSAAALILSASVVETSYFLAYCDELTGLPSRRAFNETVRNTGERYAIAIVDVDHFKRFNDTHGHETGDHVLRMVASKLARTPGGAQAFRTGGEEFAILFAGKSAKEAVPHLESLRQSVESSTFRLRRGERRQEARDSEDRRHWLPNHRRRGAKQTVDNLEYVTVSVSIGVAEPGTRNRTVTQVIQAADEALYRAKENGRNRVVLAESGQYSWRAKGQGAG